MYSVFFTYYLVMKHYAFRTLMFDLGLYDHWFWSTLKYGPIATGMFHNSLTLYILLPFYALFPSPITLIVLQSIIVPSAALPLYLLARCRLKDRGLAALVVVLFLLYPPLHGLSQFDFHVEMFIPLLTLTALYYLHTERWKRYILTSTIMLATMEYAVYIVLMMGVYQIIFYRKSLNISIGPASRFKFSIAKRMLTGLIVIALSLAYLGASTLLSNVRLPVNNPTPAPDVFSLKNLETMWETKISYLYALFGPVAFLPLLNPTPLIMAVPWLIHTAFATEPEFLKTFNQYSAFIAPFIFASLPSALEKMVFRREVKIAAMVTIIVATAYFIMATDAVATNPWPTVTGREKLLNELVQQIPPNAGVLTQNNIAPHLTRREKIFMWPVGAPGLGPKSLEEVDYILVDKSQYHYYYAPVPAGYPYDATRIAVEQLLSTGKYRMLVQEDGIEFYAREG